MGAPLPRFTQRWLDSSACSSDGLPALAPLREVWDLVPKRRLGDPSPRSSGPARRVAFEREGSNAVAMDLRRATARIGIDPHSLCRGGLRWVKQVVRGPAPLIGPFSRRRHVGGEAVIYGRRSVGR